MTLLETLTTIRTRENRILVSGIHPGIIQSIFDFDAMLGRVGVGLAKHCTDMVCCDAKITRWCREGTRVQRFVRVDQSESKRRHELPKRDLRSHRVLETVQKPGSLLGYARCFARVQESHRRGPMGATGEESFRTGSGAKTETNVRRVIKKERRVVWK